MKNIIILTVALASALTSFSQDAGERPPRREGGRGPGGPGGHRPPPLIGKLDANKDRKIDATELANAGTVLAALDKNGDGLVSLDELRPPRPADAPEPPADAPKHPTPPFFAALDTDKDGSLNATELSGAAASLAKLDKNGDGSLTPDEIMAGGPGGPGGRRGPRGDKGQN
jgi:hypothetical protein